MQALNVPAIQTGLTRHLSLTYNDSLIVLKEHISAMDIGGETNLSKRELHIIRLLLKSYSQKMIAGELGVSVETIRSHLRHIRAKLRLHSTSQIINWAYQSGLFKEPEK